MAIVGAGTLESDHEAHAPFFDGDIRYFERDPEARAWLARGMPHAEPVR